MTKNFRAAAAQIECLRGNIEENVRRHVSFVRAAAQHQCDLIVFPELSLTGYEPDIASACAADANSGVLDPLQRLSDECRITILAGCPVSSSDVKPYLAALIFRPDEFAAVYRKRFVTPDEQRYFIAGSEMFACRCRNETVTAAVCADISHPDHAGDAAKLGTTVYCAGVMMIPEDINRAWENMSRHARQHHMVTVMANHASDTGGHVTAGRSAIWDERGTLIANAHGVGECLVMAWRSEHGWEGSVAGIPVTG